MGWGGGGEEEGGGSWAAFVPMGTDPARQRFEGAGGPFTQSGSANYEARSCRSLGLTGATGSNLGCRGVRVASGS